MTAKTSEQLALVLDAVKLDQLAARARNDEFHDFLSPHAFPELLLVDLLADAANACPDLDKQLRILEIRQRVINGEFDASKEESDDWAKSPEGREAYSLLVRGK